MKRIILTLLIITTSLVYKTTVNAENINIECTNAGDTTECSITGNTEYNVSAIEFDYELSNSKSLISFEVDSSWNGDDEDFSIMLYTDVNKIGTFNLGTLKLKGNVSKNDIKTKYLAFYDENYEEHIIEGKKENVNQEKKSAKDDIKTNKNIVGYVIIIIGIVAVIAIIMIVYRRKGVSLK